MASSADPDQLACLNLHCLQRQGISGFSRTRVKVLLTTAADDILILFCFLYFSEKIRLSISCESSARYIFLVFFRENKT